MLLETLKFNNVIRKQGTVYVFNGKPIGLVNEGEALSVWLKNEIKQNQALKDECVKIILTYVTDIACSVLDFEEALNSTKRLEKVLHEMV